MTWHQRRRNTMKVKFIYDKKVEKLLYTKLNGKALACGLYKYVDATFIGARSIFVDHFHYAHAYFIKSDCSKRSLVLTEK